MTDRRSFLGWLGTITAAVGRPGGRTVNTTPVVAAHATSLYQQPDGRNNLLRVTVSELDAPAARARVIDRRGTRVADRALARGPACLTQALGIGREHNGVDLAADPAFALSPGERPAATASGPRVGVTLAAEVPWRFWVAGDETVSAYKRSPRAP